jgi:gas vesicle protein
MMKTWLAGVILAGAAAVSAQSDLARTQRQIEQLRRDVEAERQSYDADLARQKAWEAASRAQLADTRAQARRARLESDSLSRLLAAVGNPAEAKAREQKQLQSEAEALAREIADRADALLAKIQREELPGFAESKERSLRDLSRGLRTGVVSPEDGLARLADALSELIDRGRKVEARSGSYTALDGRPLDGVYVSAGGFFEGFVSKDGAFGAYRHKSPEGWAWKESLSADRRRNLLKISRMLASEEEPGFVPVPFGLISGGMQ